MSTKKWIIRIALTFLGAASLLIGLGYIYEQIARYHTQRRFPLQGQLASIGHHCLNYKAAGKGQPVVVFESGLGTAGWLTWSKVQQEVSAFSATFSYSRAGILWSERGPGYKTGEAMSDELYTLLKNTQQRGPYILVAHSLAGLTLRPFIEKHSSQIAGIVLVDASHPDQPRRLGALPTGPPIWLAKFMCQNGIVRLFNIGASQYPNTSPDDSINLIANAYLPLSIPTYLEETEHIKPLAAEAGKITSFGAIPLIIITGENRSAEGDDFKTKWMEMQSELLALSTNSQQLFANKSGHYIQLEQPELVVQAIQQLVNKERASHEP